MGSPWFDNARDLPFPQLTMWDNAEYVKWYADSAKDGVRWRAIARNRVLLLYGDFGGYVASLRVEVESCKKVHWVADEVTTSMPTRSEALGRIREWDVLVVRFFARVLEALSE